MSNFVLSILVEAKDAASGVFGNVGDALSGLGKVGLAVAGAGVAALGGALVAAVGNAIEAQDVFAQTEAVVKSTGGAAGLSAQQMADLASSLSAAAGKSTWGDELILSGENVLATFTNIGKEVFPLATQAALDMATALHSTPEAMSMMIGKALSSADGINALKRSGVSFSEEQQKVIKRLFATGHAAEAQKMMLAELAKEFGGSAAAAAQTFSGQLGTLKDKFGELLEGVGTQLLPILTQFVGFLNTNVAPAIEQGVGQAVTVVTGLFQAFATGMQGDGGIIGGLSNLLFNLDSVSPAFDVLGDAVVTIGGLLDDTFGAGGGLGVLLDDVREMTGIDLGPVVAAFQGLVGAGQPLIATFTDAKSPIDGFIAVLARISPTFALVKAAIDAALPPIQQIITSVFGILGGFLQEHGAKIRSDVGGAWQQIQQIIAAVTPPIQQIISTIFGAIATFLQAHGTEIKAFLAESWDAIAAIVRTALEIIQAVVVPVLTFIAGFISAHGTQIQALLSQAWNAIRLVVGTALTLIRGILTAALQAIHGDWSGAWATIKTMSATVVQNLIDLFKLGLENLKTLFLLAWDLIKGIFGDALAKILAGIVITFDQMVSTVRSFGDKIVSAATSVGDGIIRGIVDGVKNGVGALVDAVTGAAQRALDAAKNALGIHSPSTIFAGQVGTPMMDGVAVGVRAGGATIQQALDDTLGRAIAHAQGAVRNLSGGLGGALGGRQGDGRARTGPLPDIGRDLFGGAATQDLAGGMAREVPQSGGNTTNITNILNYQGVHQGEGDVRTALRAQALLTGAMG